MLSDGYGVLSGVLTKVERDTPDNQGNWFHVKLEVQTPDGLYQCAIDVDSHDSAVGVEWKTIVLRPNEWTQTTGLADGFHILASSSESGALDYIRDFRFQPNPGCIFVKKPGPLLEWISNLIKRMIPDWNQGNNEDAATALEDMLEVGQRIFVFGEPFTYGGLGVHNIHQNQGDPIDSQWADENGVWQDGATIVQRSNGSLLAFLNKFSSQSYKTDENGHPI